MKTDGVQCVMTTGEERMLWSSAVSWDSLEVPHWNSLPEALMTIGIIGWTMLGAGAKIKVDSNTCNESRKIQPVCLTFVTSISWSM